MSQRGQEQHFTPLTECTAAYAGLHFHRHWFLLAAWTLPTLGTLKGVGRAGSGNESWDQLSRMSLCQEPQEWNKTQREERSGSQGD